MTERLSDERLRELLESQMQWHGKEFIVAPMARELLELRAETIALTGALKMAAAERDNFAAALSAGPVMPEVPSDGVRQLMRDCCDPIGCIYEAIRAALLEEQSR